MDPP
jgi:hypothetical protein